ncbi:DUF3618 domain-containing protein [Myceligenerans pegani]|uniref:DUF3618 domain-containing protein n=1 Tax=Myceligenerans pegani TaxID=2776917 RepID=A0ABR9N3X1_9MICO|nr:DUF3618 domain-containing protein [Myceligenerans sp. TRM 65318]MBE1877702.1 DUF3618 domain-containing protein [Myceligenerans sp. TRM 65318]MBE3019973.1 DUF3618 domain-containing protein [Myceligenerans sp. TRM 65318]
MSTNDPEAIRDDIERTRGELSRDVDALGDRVNPSHMARRRMDRMRSGVTHLKERVMGTTHDTVGTAQDTGHEMADKGREAAASAADRARGTASSVAETVGSTPRAVREQTQGNPLAVGMVAFGVGLVVASLLPSSRTERRAAVAVEENAGPIEDVRAGATEAVHDLQEPARESAEAVRDAASDAARSLGEHGREAADDIRSRATGEG